MFHFEEIEHEWKLKESAVVMGGRSVCDCFGKANLFTTGQSIGELSVSHLFHSLLMLTQLV